MSEEDRIKWEQRYAEDSYRKNNPVTLLEDWLPELPLGKALDVACGAGRNSIFLARAGYAVDAIDISATGLQKASENAVSQGLVINWIENDLDQPYDFTHGYDLIVVMWYVNLPLITKLCDCLAPGGFLLSEQHLVTEQAVIGPRSPEYRVRSGALREAVSCLQVLLYEESIDPTPEGDRLASARVVACNRP